MSERMYANGVDAVRASSGCGGCSGRPSSCASTWWPTWCAARPTSSTRATSPSGPAAAPPCRPSWARSGSGSLVAPSGLGSGRSAWSALADTATHRSDHMVQPSVSREQRGPCTYLAPWALADQRGGRGRAVADGALLAWGPRCPAGVRRHADVRAGPAAAPGRPSSGWTRWPPTSSTSCGRAFNLASYLRRWRIGRSCGAPPTPAASLRSSPGTRVPRCRISPPQRRPTA
jgi:hypothetical protein